MPPLVTHLLFDRIKWNDLLASAVLPYLTEYLKRGGQVGAGQAQAIGLIGQFDVTNPKVTEYLSRYAFDLVTGINDFSAEAYRSVITAGLEQGQGIREIAQAISDDPTVGPQGSAYRSEMIARTESAIAQTEGVRLAHEESNSTAADAGIAEPFLGYRFVNSPDACDECVAYEGTEMPMDGNLDYVHPNDRCNWETIINPVYL